MNSKYKHICNEYPIISIILLYNINAIIRINYNNN